MTAKKRGLGRGLDALLGLGAEQVAIEEANGDQLKTVPVDLIQRGVYQPFVPWRRVAAMNLSRVSGAGARLNSRV